MKVLVLFVVVLQEFSVESVPIQYNKRSTVNNAVGNYSTGKLVFL
jgi:hypothetical protein